MAGSSTHPLCDYCDESAALIYCRIDSAGLCISCDRLVHSGNRLSFRHTRSLICDACDSSPASIFCETEHSVFCQNCDGETHNSNSPVHNRRPIEGFSGSPSVDDLVNLLGFDDLGDKRSPVFVENNGLGIDDLIVSTDSPENYQALGIPPLPKNRNTVCGRRKEEIFHQLRKLAKLEPDSNSENLDSEAFNGYKKTPAAEQNSRPRDLYTGYDSDLVPPVSMPAFEPMLSQVCEGFHTQTALEPLPQTPSCHKRQRHTLRIQKIRRHPSSNQH